MKKGNLIITGMFLAILLASLASAFGVSSSYWKGRPLEVYPGQETTVILGLQNMVGTEDIKVKAFVTKGNEIASIPDKEYLIKVNTKDTGVPVKIKIPSNATSAAEYTVTVSFVTINEGETPPGGVAIGTGVDTSFPVLVTGTPPKAEAGSLTWILIIGIIVIIIIIIAIVLKRKKKR